MSGWSAVRRAVLGSARGLLNDAVTMAFPADCRCCEGPLERASLVPVCEGCLARVRRSEMAGCRRCGEAVDLDLDMDVAMEDLRFAGMRGMECRMCKASPPDFVRAVSYGVHAEELRELIALLKFQRVRGVAELLASRLAEVVLGLEGEAGAELLVVAVPLFAGREKWRGFNQSVLLGDAALKRLKALRPKWRLRAAHGVLRRVRETESSFRLSLKGRRENLKGAFQVTGDVVGQEVLLIDDIYTSGATARECARVLVRAGASKVWVATLARAQKESVRRQHEDPGEYVAAWDLGQTAAV